MGVVQTMNAMRSQYGADMVYLVLRPSGTTVADLRHPSVLTYEDLLAQKLVLRDHILEVQTLADVVKSKNNNIIPDDLEAVKALLAQEPRAEPFIDETRGVALLHVRSDTGASAAIIRETINAIKEDVASLEDKNPGVTVTLTGFNAVDKATFELIISDFMKITLYSFLFMLAFLFLYYRGNGRSVWQALSVIVFALVWTLGLTGYLGITITVVSMVAAAMIMALGISYGIHAVHRYKELREKHARTQALSLMQQELLLAFTGSSFTTSAGFLALLFGVLPAMKNLGIILALGIIITLIVSVFVTPTLLYITDGGRKQ
ncbi:hypothetical protein D6789_04655 [Candidatus Woesearchaeota archaeon]|nr:MAG: hypothetical protein D6789_04655 [Candidatus Woesearchaeota archaeon]